MPDDMPKAVIGYDINRDEYWIAANGMVVRLPDQMTGDLTRTLTATVFSPAPAPRALHASDCAVHNAPALPVGPCDCGARPPRRTPRSEALANARAAIAKARWATAPYMPHDVAAEALLSAMRAALDVLGLPDA